MGMIDISSKKKTKRIAKANACVKLNKDIIERIKNNRIPKGNVLEVAKVAAILAVKNTPFLVPLCHNIEIKCVNLNFKFTDETIVIESLVKAVSETGVEMEALVAVTAASLTIYDMCKMFTKAIEITEIYLLEKKGGKSGVYQRK